MNEQQRNQWIATQLNQGLSLSEIQKQLLEEHQINITYMDLRMLAADLESVDWDARDPKTEEPEADEESTETAESAPNPGELQVSISSIVRPGCALSGDVTFPSGIHAEWYVDSMGRLGLDTKGEEQPGPEELVEFQHELQRQVTAQSPY